MAYLVGDFADRDWFKYVNVQDGISKDDLIKASQNSTFQVINLDTMEYFDPDTNAWVKFEEERHD